MFDTEGARELLSKAGLFFYDNRKQLDEFGDGNDSELLQTLNLNDVWGWAVADGEYIPDENLAEAAELFYRYGNCGILYWVSERRGGERSEFRDVNRFIDFVREEEKLRREIPNPSKRAYKKITYALGE